MTNDAIDALTKQAKALQEKIDLHDQDIADAQKERGVIAKQLRSVTTKIVTLQIKSAK